jgi:hypothetical protein
MGMAAATRYARVCALAVALAAGGCASVSTQVTVLEPAQKFAPTQNIPILMDYPARAHAKIALIEVEGTIGGGEGTLLEEARKRAQALGADAVVRTDFSGVYYPPVKVYDPWYGDPFYWHFRYSHRPYYFYPPGYGPYPYGEYRWIGGGTAPTLKAMAIRYLDR